MGRLLELEKVNLHYKSHNTSVQVIKDADLNIEIGEKVAIVGKSGSGKTSLIMLIAGLERPTSGKITFDGKIISALSENELADIRRESIGIVFQSFYLIPNYTALENVSLILEINNVQNARKKAADLLSQFGLSDRLNHFPTQLSGGEQQRVAIARSMAVMPKLILADEPTGNLDTENSKLISKLLFDFAKKNNSSFILVTHDQGFAAECDRVIKIEDGKIL